MTIYTHIKLTTLHCQSELCKYTCDTSDYTQEVVERMCGHIKYKNTQLLTGRSFS